MPTRDQLQAQQAQQNLNFMALSYESAIEANAQNGTAYQAGNSINFDVPIVAGAWLTRLTIRPKLTVTYTPAGVSPYINLTAAAQYAAFSNIEVRFGNKQIEVHPYIMKVLAQLRGYNRTSTNSPLGNTNSDIQTLLATQPGIATGANTWNFDIDVPLNLLHPLNINGILPISGTGTRVQVLLTPTSGFQGKDPLLSCVDTNGTIVVSGSVEVIAWYRSNQSTATLAQLSPNPAGISTVQVIKPQQLNPLTAGTSVFQRITNPYKFVHLISLVIDGQQSGKFVSNASNIQNYELDQAENTSSLFFKYDVTNGTMANYYKTVREKYGQDFDSGVLIFSAPGTNSANASNQDGGAYLDLTATGYPAARLGYQVGMVGESAVTGITPRVETWGVIINPAGIQAV